ncbi:MAG: hypothetical protein AB2531_04100, partial [Candidatus Thiodiazotropha sp.]
MSRGHTSTSRDYQNDYHLDQISTSDSLGVINPTESIRGALVFNQLVVSKQSSHEIFGKRQFDIIMSLLILLIASPVMLS